MGLVFNKSPVGAEQKRSDCLGAVDEAFSRLVTIADDPAGYAPDILIKKWRLLGLG